MFTKSMSSKYLFDPHTAESLADTLYELGKDLGAKRQFPMAIKWLDRSHEVLTTQEPDKLSINAGELRVSITESLVKANLKLQDPVATERAKTLLDALEADIGQKLIVLLMRLELLSASTDESFDSISYSDILHRMTLSMVLSEANFKLIMHHIRKLNGKSPTLACQVLDEFVRSRVLPEEKENWIEKVIITRVWLTLRLSDDLAVITSLTAFLVVVSANIKKPVAPAASLAAHTVSLRDLIPEKAMLTTLAAMAAD